MASVVVYCLPLPHMTKSYIVPVLWSPKPTAWMNTVQKHQPPSSRAVEQLIKTFNHHARRHSGPPAVYIPSKQVHRQHHHRHPPHALSYQEQKKTCWSVWMLFTDYSAAFSATVAFKLIMKLRDLGLNRVLCSSSACSSTICSSGFLTQPPLPDYPQWW